MQAIFRETPPSQTVIPRATQSSIEAIVVDLDGVLCATNILQAFSETGIAITFKFIVEQHAFPSKNRLFDALAAAGAKSTVKSCHKGLCMPQIMVDWQCGLQDLDTIQMVMIDHIHRLGLSKTEKNFFIQTIMWMMDPKKFVGTRRLIKEGVKLLHEIKEKGYKLYILSNWDPFSFDTFQSKFSEIFVRSGSPIFSGIMTSGQMKTLKPDLAIYKVCIDRFKLNPGQAIFIDDTPENIQGAQISGFKTIICNNEKIDEVRLQLIKMLNDA